MRRTFDYVVVGAGSAGAIIAAKLSDDPALNVLLLEAGPDDCALTIRMPAAVSVNIKGSRYNWQYRSEPQSALNNRTLYQPRGKVLGGSSSLNGMIYIRGHAFDYDRWSEEGARGWSYAEVLPYFKRIEKFSGGEDDYRGAKGPIPVTRGWASSPLHEAFLEAGQQAGHPFTTDVNGRQQHGVSYFDKNILDGERWSSSRGYIAPRRSRTNLHILTNALVSKVTFKRQMATGVEVLAGQGIQRFEATREVILCAGAFNSPKILLLSGIGNADDLKSLGIPIVHNAPEVGANLQDHTEVHVQYRCTEPITLYGELRPLKKLYNGVRWFINRTGQAATNHYDTGAFLFADEAARHPDCQLHFVPIVYNNSVERRVDCHGFRVHAGPMRCVSRGNVRLRSADPLDAPRIQPNYFTAERDWEAMEQKIVDLSREIFAQKAFDRFRGPEMSPGVSVRDKAGMDSFIREWGDTGYHPSSTCRMGADTRAVVAADGRVQGVTGLRIVDASTMPSIVSGNLNAPVMMMADKVSDLILGRAPLKAQNPEIIGRVASTSLVKEVDA